MITLWASIILLALIFVVVALGKIEAALIALLTAVVVIGTGLLPQEVAFASVDWNTIFLLIGMMIVVGVTKRTGVFQYLAIKSAKLAKGDPVRILIFFSFVTAIVSAFLDNVTTVLLVAPVTLLIADSLEVNPVPFLVCEAVASNIGGTATLIGDPPNIMIGSAAGLGFNAFISNLAPVVFIILFIFLGGLYFIFRSRFKVNPELKSTILELDEIKAITDIRLARICLIVFGITLLGFILHERLHLEPATVALLGASLSLLLAEIPTIEIFKEVEWTTIFFFIGLFIVVSAVKEQGVFAFVSGKVLTVTRGHFLLTTFLILWVSAFASAFVGAVPFVATMIPLLHQVGAGLSGQGIVLWWALSLGACLGGNGTLTGTAANMVVTAISGQHDQPISYAQFFRYGFPVMLLSLIVSTLYLFLRYF